ncbi:MAG: hypothetical protein HRT74_13695 [Flavobacteriales bacterium]|nr:hypothetical protein [Flavobacteriales bacterium]
MAKLKWIFGLLSGILIGASVAFKVMHLMGAKLLLASGALVFCFGFLPFLFIDLYERSIQKTRDKEMLGS